MQCDPIGGTANVLSLFLLFEYRPTVCNILVNVNKSTECVIMVVHSTLFPCNLRWCVGVGISAIDISE